ncbi:hypothetical protein [Bremerella alba]|uniref:Lipoprotein n=1 Tax=Bremerella alba TaxID=980252 RepID=A0A7V8V227_9BACT|nr:hypothetical protein [Bremerella alba]MBA2113214.1 hypothetical protein [Bremerella alba]
MKYSECFLVPLGMVAVYLVAGGCSHQSNLGSVHGTVTYDGKPLKRGAIIVEVEGNRPSHGQIEDGQILNLSTFTANDGVPVGEAKVAVNSFAEPDLANHLAANLPSDRPPETGNIVSGKNQIPLRYANPATSGLTATIKPGENDLSFDLSK